MCVHCIITQHVELMKRTQDQRIRKKSNLEIHKQKINLLSFSENLCFTEKNKVKIKLEVALFNKEIKKFFEKIMTISEIAGAKVMR